MHSTFDTQSFQGVQLDYVCNILRPHSGQDLADSPSISLCDRSINHLCCLLNGGWQSGRLRHHSHGPAQHNQHTVSQTNVTYQIFISVADFHTSSYTGLHQQVLQTICMNKVSKLVHSPLRYQMYSLRYQLYSLFQTIVQRKTPNCLRNTLKTKLCFVISLLPQLQPFIKRQILTGSYQKMLIPIYVTFHLLAHVYLYQVSSTSLHFETSLERA